MFCSLTMMVVCDSLRFPEFTKLYAKEWTLPFVSQKLKFEAYILNTETPTPFYDSFP